MASTAHAKLRSSEDVEGARTLDLLARLERIPFSAWHVQVRLIVGSATFFDAVDTLAIAYVLPTLAEEWRLTAWQIGLLIASGYAGQLLGAVVFGWLAERRGRLTALVHSVAIYSVLSFVCATAWGYTPLSVFRFLQGFGLGGEVPVAAVYISELARARGRGRFFLLYEQVYALGRVAAALLGVWMVARFGWRSLFVCGGLSAVLVFVLRQFLQESPRWLACRGRLDEAEKVIGSIETHVTARGGVLDAPPGTPAFANRPIQTKTSLRELFSAAYRSRTVTAWALWFSAYLVMNGLSTWVPTLYRTAFHLPVQLALNYGVVSSIAGFGGCLAVAMLVDRTGRRNWFAGAFLVPGAACIALAVFGSTSAIAMLILTSITVFFINSNAMLLFLHTSEIYPTRMRAIATSVASAWMRLASIAGPLLIGWSMSRWQLSSVFLQFAIVTAAAGVIAWRWVVETRGRVLEEISR
jgi:MFS transporter, putative metabolite:H+ symporter